MESGGGGRRHVHDFAAERAYQLAVARVGRVCDEHFVVIVDRQRGGQQQCRRTACGNRDAFRVDVDVVTFLIEIGNRLAQFRQAHRRGVRQRTAVILFAHGVTHGRRRAEVRLAEAQLDHIDAVGDHLIGHGSEHHGAERIGNLRALRQLRLRAILNISHIPVFTTFRTTPPADCHSPESSAFPESSTISR